MVPQDHLSNAAFSAWVVWTEYEWPLGDPPSPPLTTEQWAVLGSPRLHLEPGSSETDQGYPEGLILSMVERGLLRPLTTDQPGRSFVPGPAGRNALIHLYRERSA